MARELPTINCTRVSQLLPILRVMSHVAVMTDVGFRANEAVYVPLVPMLSFDCQCIVLSSAHSDHLVVSSKIDTKSGGFLTSQHRYMCLALTHSQPQ